MRAYSITSSAVKSNFGGTSSHKACAALRLITKSNFAGTKESAFLAVRSGMQTDEGLVKCDIVGFLAGVGI